MATSREDFIAMYCTVANAALEAAKLTDAAAIVKSVEEDMRHGYPNQPEWDLLLQHISANFSAALTPSGFFNTRTRKYNAEFVQNYELMRQTFEADVLDEKEVYRNSFPQTWLPAEPPTLIMIGRFWQVSGLQEYDNLSGKLKKFRFDPSSATEEIVSTISGTFMSMESVGRKESLGAIGYAATREGMRGAGHGYQLVQAFEDEIRASAKARGEILRLMVVESEEGARKFWARCGYRWPRSCDYVQPPISYDSQTGEPNFPAAPEMLMVKLIDSPTPDVIDRTLLLDAIKVMFQKWFGVPDGTAEAKKKADEHLFGVLLPQIAESMRAEPDLIPLEMPPAISV